MDVKIFAAAAAILISSTGATADRAAPFRPLHAPHMDHACLIEGELYGEPTRDCTQTSLPLPAADYAEQCQSNSAGPLRATVVAACPAKAQAVCVNPYGQQVTVHYYARSPKSLADTKASCLAQKGKWVDHP